ncbi:glycosyltransferase [Priestia megaterium]|uniref:glycosyltransferase n=1 Tax=Priestia megaterium TaxID=1404 RepID=UPI002EB6B3AB|nr:glycosyltransferase [Priestia megaterium]
MKKKIITFNGVYKPGYKAGGPIKSISNMASVLKEDVDFLVVASDRDYGDTSPYKSIKVNAWNRVDNEEVYYHHSDSINIYKFYKLLKRTEYDVAYLNGYYSNYTRKYLFLSKLNLIRNVPIIVSPRGDFTEGDSNNFWKKYKKKIYIMLLNSLRFNTGVTWHATSKQEEQDIKNNIGENINIHQAPNITLYQQTKVNNRGKSKEAGKLNLIYLSRIAPKKNLIGAIKLLDGIKGEVNFNIYGPIFDESYWRLCKKEIEKLPPNITVNYKGSIENKNIYQAFDKNHFFLFPTFGENYGHVIVESFLGGCPVIISNQTPWRELQKRNIGWDISLSNTQKFQEVIQECVHMKEAHYNQMVQESIVYGRKNPLNESSIKQLKKLFSSLL